MTGLPKFVRDQMARTPVPSSHPDANVLSAFTENTLTVEERQQIVQHLSICADCREIVYLAQPEAAATQTILATKPRRLTWMAWASVAAVVVVVASSVILQREEPKPQPTVTVATTTSPQGPEAKPAAPATTSGADMTAVDTKTRAETRREAELDAGKTKASTGRLLTAKDLSNEQRADLNAPAPVAVPPPVANQQVIVAAATPQQPPTGPEQRNIAGQIQQSQGPANTVNNVNTAAANETLAKPESAPAAKVAKKQRDNTFHGLADGYAALPAAAPVPAVRAHWRISSTGTLERSYAADNWSPVLAESGVRFHVVSVIGNTVWAGGEHGALYVSCDGGSTWKPVATGTTATITSVGFSDDLHGTLETADGQGWETSDGGKSWQKQ